MYRMTILYGGPHDPDTFGRYYDDTHVPVARKMDGLTGWNLSRGESDPEHPSPWLPIAELYAVSKAAMDAVLGSSADLAASADLANFVTGSVTSLRGPDEQGART